MKQIWFSITTLLLLFGSEILYWVKTPYFTFTAVAIPIVVSLPSSTSNANVVPLERGYVESTVVTETQTNAITKKLEKPKKTTLKVTEQNVFGIMDGLLECESSGRRGAYNPKDIDGRPKFGEFQYDSRTWNAWSMESGITGDPTNRADAIKMTRWALLRGFGKSWGCFNTAVENYLKNEQAKG